MEFSKNNLNGQEDNIIYYIHNKFIIVNLDKMSIMIIFTL